MKFWKYLSFIFISFLLVIALAGCREQFQPAAFTDDMGRSVNIDKAPERIISFGPSITEILFALELDDRIAGVDAYSDYPEAARSKPSVGDAFSPSLEKVAELQPDLVLTVKHQQLMTQLDTLGVKYLVIDPKTIDDIISDIELLGKVTNTKAKAASVVKDMRETISAVTTRVKGAPPVKTLFIIDATDPNNPWTTGAGSFIDSLITGAGGENVAAGTTGDWLQISMEQVVSSNPEVIITQTMTGGIPTISKETLDAHPIWQGLDAVKQGKVMLIDGDIVSRPGPRIVQGLEEMAKIVHPELFK